MSGTLYIVATPIGNLGDLTPTRGGNLCKSGFYCRRRHPCDAEAAEPPGPEKSRW